MKDSVLKKEFSRRDVQRMRNLISGRAGDNTHTQIGWEKRTIKRSEGEVWEDSGKIWTIKNGIKQTVTKLDEFKKMVVLPIACPSCKKAMKVNDLNKRSYSHYGVCLNCAIEVETKMKIDGVFQEKMEKEGKAYVNSVIDDLQKALEVWYNSEESFLNEQGDVENWMGGNKEETYNKTKEELDKLKYT
jgi:hypothetical protein